MGFRTRCAAGTLVALVKDAIAQLAGQEPALASDAFVLATIAEKDRPPLREASAALGLPVLLLPKTALADTADRITVDSARVRTCLGIPSVAEAAALAAAGLGSRLVVPRIAVPDATCAIAAASPP